MAIKCFKKLLIDLIKLSFKPYLLGEIANYATPKEQQPRKLSGKKPIRILALERD
jgi:hypothetical protein